MAHLYVFPRQGLEYCQLIEKTKIPIKIRQ
jgi:hypothetical protein